MTDPASRLSRDAPTLAPIDVSAEIASLRLAGVDRFDPVRWHYLNRLAQRANAHQGRVKGLLEDKLGRSVAALRERFAQAQSETRHALVSAGSSHPQVLGDLQRLFDAGDFKGVNHCIATAQHREPGSCLRELVLYMAQQSAAQPEAGAPGALPSRPELKTTRHFRKTWSKLSADKQLTQALDLAPKNAGPINPHMLVLRSLRLMRDISPDYLNRFTSYVDALLCLDQGNKGKPGQGKQAADAGSRTQSKSRRRSKPR